MILTPSQYAERFYGGSVTSATIRNWIKRNKLPAGHNSEKTPTGHYIIRVDAEAKSKARTLVEMMKAKAA